MNILQGRNSTVTELLQENGKIVSEINTSLAFGEVLNELERNDNQFLIRLLEVCKHLGHIQQQDKLPFGLYNGTEIRVIDV